MNQKGLIDKIDLQLLIVVCSLLVIMKREDECRQIVIFNQHVHECEDL